MRGAGTGNQFGSHTQCRLPGNPARIKLFGFLVFVKVHVALVRQILFFSQSLLLLTLWRPHLHLPFCVSGPMITGCLLNCFDKDTTEKQSIILNTTRASSLGTHNPSLQLRRVPQTGRAELSRHALGLPRC